MKIVTIKCCSRQCLEQLEKDFTISEVQELIADGGLCPVCGQRIIQGFSVEIFEEDSTETIECCSLECAKEQIESFGQGSVKIMIPQKNKNGVCSICGQELQHISFKLVISEPK